MPRKLISFDWAIKRILRSKANFEILEGFLSELLKENITILEVLESESNQDLKNDKFNRLDIPIEAIKFRMEQEGLKQKDLVNIVGSKSRVSEILNRKRKLTIEMIRNLHKQLHIPVESLFLDYKTSHA